MFNKNPNEVNYPSGKKNITNVIKNTGPTDAVIFRQPEEDFNTNSTLIVMPGEEALFIHNGKIENSFAPGTYKLTTENYPFISRLRNVFSGGISTFNCVVVFVRTSSTKEIQWGDRLALRDPIWKIQTDLGTGGAYRIRVCDGGKLLTMILGSTQTELPEQSVNEYFSSFMKMKIKSVVSKIIRDSQIEILGLEANLDEFSQCVKPYLSREFADYGLDLQAFTIDRLTILDNDIRNELERNFGKSAGMNAMGENWARDRLANALQALAENTGSGGIASAAAGLGLGISAMPAFSSIIQQISGPSPSSSIVDAITGNPQLGQNQQGSGSTTTTPTADRYRKANTKNESQEANLSSLCPACKTINPANSRFCCACGAVLEEKSVCTRCGKQSPPGSAFCNHCGNKL